MQTYAQFGVCVVTLSAVAEVVGPATAAKLTTATMRAPTVALAVAGPSAEAVGPPAAVAAASPVVAPAATVGSLSVMASLGAAYQDNKSVHRT